MFGAEFVTTATTQPGGVRLNTQVNRGLFRTGINRNSERSLPLFHLHEVTPGLKDTGPSILEVAYPGHLLTMGVGLPQTALNTSFGTFGIAQYNKSGIDYSGFLIIKGTANGFNNDAYQSALLTRTMHNVLVANNSEIGRSFLMDCMFPSTHGDQERRRLLLNQLGRWTAISNTAIEIISVPTQFSPEAQFKRPLTIWGFTGDGDYYSHLFAYENGAPINPHNAVINRLLLTDSEIGLLGSKNQDQYYVLGNILNSGKVSAAVSICRTAY